MKQLLVPSGPPCYPGRREPAVGLEKEMATGLVTLEIEVGNPANPQTTEKVDFLIDSGAIYSVRIAGSDCFSKSASSTA